MITRDNMLIADSGMVLTNGVAYGKTVRLGRYGNAEDWQEITEEEYQKILQEQEAQDERQANI